MTIQWKCFQDEKPEMKKNVLVRFEGSLLKSYYFKMTSFDHPFQREKNKYSESYYEFFCNHDRSWEPVDDQSRIFWEYLDK